MRIALFVLLAAMSLGATGSQAQEKYTIATTEAGLSAAKAFAELAATRLEDAELEAFSDLVGLAELPEAAASGLVQIAVVPISILPATGPLRLPFLSNDAAGMRRAIESPAGAFVTYRLEQEGFVVLDYWHLSTDALGTAVPVERLADLEGVKVRTPPGALDSNVMAALGASPQTAAFGEIFTSLQRGAFDGTVLPYGEQSRALGFTEVINNYADRPYRARIYAVLIPLDAWQDMPIATQAALSEAASEVAVQVEQVAQAQIETFRQNELERGATFAVWTAGETLQIRNAVLESGGLGDPNVDTETEALLIQTAFEAAAPQPQQSLAADTGRAAGAAGIWFATDRKASSGAILGLSYTAKRAQSDISYGTAQINLKVGRKLGDELTTGTEITDVTTIADDDFLDVSLTDVANSGRDVIIFVHGYNNTFADAIMRGATIVADMSQDAELIAFSWPSDGHALRYAYDESSARSSTSNFKNFMRRLTKKVPPERVSILAHSMGTRLVVKYIESLQDAEVDPEDMKFANFIFAASDIAKHEFLQVEESAANPDAAAMSSFADNVTIYASEFDAALGLSQFIHSDVRVGRAPRQDMVDDPDMVTVDASLIDPKEFSHNFRFVTRHSYVFDKPEGVADVSGVLAGEAPDTRGGLLHSGNDGSAIWWMPGPQ